jgi:tRNA A37 methylthiotransferase MiaB
MGRKHSVEDYIETVDEIRSAFKINLWTDVIVGFPGETDGQFRNTMELMKRVDPDLVNISRYAMRPGTPAELFRQLPTEVVKERTRMLTNQMQNIAFVKNKEQIGWKGDILISERGKRDGQWIGRNYAYKSVVINKSGNLLGRYVRVKIIDAVPDALIGWPITEQEDSL